VRFTTLGRSKNHQRARASSDAEITPAVAPLSLRITKVWPRASWVSEMTPTIVNDTALDLLAEYRDLAALADTLTPAQWRAPSASTAGRRRTK